MIVCSCNVLSDVQILAALKSEGALRPSSPAGVYRCLGCAPRCGRCVSTIRAMLEQAHGAACHVGCATCPAHETPLVETGETEAPAYRIAAE